MTATTASGAGRPRNAARSREDLLAAAAELFSERGYEGTTIREVGALAGVDPALIARYFGGKPQLYLASLRRDDQGNALPIDLRDAERLQVLLDRVSKLGITPSLYAAIRPHEDTHLQAAAVEILEQRVLAPSARAASDAGLDQARLRAEIATAAMVGVILSRTRGAFDTLSQAPSQEVARLVADMIGELLEG